MKSNRRLEQLHKADLTSLTEPKRPFKGDSTMQTLTTNKKDSAVKKLDKSNLARIVGGAGDRRGGGNGGGRRPR